MFIINIYMRNYFKLFKHKAGFTLIELLVVIGILGVLAAALIATIDPFEQLKKAQDANSKNTAVEFIGASIRYYTTHNTLPWTDTGAPAACQTDPTPNGYPLSGNPQMSSCLDALVTDGELKSGFTTVTTVLSTILVAGDSVGVTSCFRPISKSQIRDNNTKFLLTGGTFVASNTCVSQVGGTVTTCYWCSQ